MAEEIFEKIKKKIEKRKNLYLLIGISLLVFVIYFPSLFNFYTNDDFFHLRIAKANSLSEFLNFFNLTKAPEGWGLYRPLTTQVFYFLTVKFFNLNPIPLHIISFLVLFLNIFLVYKLASLISKNTNLGLIAAFLYGTSATHFGHLYFLGAFQELGMAAFFLLSVLSFMKFLKEKKKKHLIFSFLSFIGGLLSKETAVVIPAILIPVYFLVRERKETKFSLKEILFYLVPFFGFLGVYAYLRINYYGITTGESYIWDFSGRIINTLFWYILWSFNIPEMLVDFVGPGLTFNPNLFKYYSREIVPIFVMFGGIMLGIIYLKLKNLREILNKKSLVLIIFCFLWFVISLLPVLFLPLHKFTFYLTVPLLGIVILISYLLILNKGKSVTIIFLGIWTALSIATLSLTYKTNWITRGGETAKRVHEYFERNRELLSQYKEVSFYDTQEDENLPWSPSLVLKDVLSNKNYFKVFWNDKLVVKYYNSEKEIGEKEALRLKARPFLGY